MYILGFHGGPRGSHEAGIALINLHSGETEVVLQEERFNRFKSSVSCFPIKCLEYAFREGLFTAKQLSLSASAGETYDDMKIRIPDFLEHNFGIRIPHYSFHHQLCHASNAFFSSGFSRSLIVSLDGIGDRESGVIAIGQDDAIETIRFVRKDESVGFYWSLLCQAIGYDGLEDAYKVMGLAPFGSPKYDLSRVWRYKGDLEFQLGSEFIEDKFRFISKHAAERVYSDKSYHSVFGESYSRRLLVEPLREVIVP